MNQTRASLAFQGADWNCLLIFELADIGMIQREDLGDSESAAPIPNQALFCDCPACRGTVYADSISSKKLDGEKTTIRYFPPDSRLSCHDTHTLNF